MPRNANVSYCSPALGYLSHGPTTGPQCESFSWLCIYSEDSPYERVVCCLAAVEVSVVFAVSKVILCASDDGRCKYEECICKSSGRAQYSQHFIMFYQHFIIFIRFHRVSSCFIMFHQFSSCFIRFQGVVEQRHCGRYFSSREFPQLGF